jgi:hypothetical protein
MSKDRSKFSSFDKEQKIFDKWRNYLHEDEAQIKLISEQEENPLNAQLAQLRADTSGKAEDTDTIVGSMAADKPIARAGDFDDDGQPGAAGAVAVPQPEPEGIPRRTISSQEAGKPAEIAARGDAIAIAAARENVTAYKSGKISGEKFKRTKARIVADEESRAMAEDRPGFEDLGYVPPEPGEGAELTRGGEYWIQDEDGMPIPLTMSGEGAHVAKGKLRPMDPGVGLESDFMRGKTDLPSKKAMQEMDPPMMDQEGRLTRRGRSFAVAQHRKRLAKEQEAEAGAIAEQLGGTHKPQARRARRSLDAISNVSGLPIDPDLSRPGLGPKEGMPIDPGLSRPGLGPKEGMPIDPDLSRPRRRPERRPKRAPENDPPELEPGPWQPAPMPETEPGPWQPAPMPETEPGPWQPAPMPETEPGPWKPARPETGPWRPPSPERGPARPETGPWRPPAPERGPATPPWGRPELGPPERSTMLEQIIREELHRYFSDK